VEAESGSGKWRMEAESGCGREAQASINYLGMPQVPILSGPLKASIGGPSSEESQEKVMSVGRDEVGGKEVLFFQLTTWGIVHLNPLHLNQLGLTCAFCSALRCADADTDTPASPHLLPCPALPVSLSLRPLNWARPPARL
jgi:hypothetical protein